MNATLDKLFSEFENAGSNFVELLSAERDVLLNGLADQLPEITHSKQQALSELDTLDRRLKEIVKSDEQGNIALFQFGTLQERWNQIIEILSECQRMNIENGSIVQLRIKNTQAALEHLHYLPGNETSCTYDQQGHKAYDQLKNRSVIA